MAGNVHTNFVAATGIESGLFTDWVDDLVRKWAWWLRKNFDFVGYPTQFYEGYTDDYVDEWTAAFIASDEEAVGVLDFGISKHLCSLFEEGTKYEYRATEG